MSKDSGLQELRAWVLGSRNLEYFPEGPSTQYLMTLAPNTIKSMVSGTGTRNLKYWVLEPSGLGYLEPLCPIVT